MENRAQVTGPAFCCRRLLKTDLPALCALDRAALAPNAAFTCAELQTQYEAGIWLGVFAGAQLAAAALLLPAAARCAPARQVRGLSPVLALSESAMLLVPVGPVCAPEQHACALTGLLAFAQGLLARAGQPELCCVAPVKTARALGAYFAAGFALFAVRPLWRLTPCYLFLPCRQPGPAAGALRLPAADTLAVSRALENGWRALALENEEFLLCRSADLPGP